MQGVLGELINEGAYIRGGLYIFVIRVLGGLINGGAYIPGGLINASKQAKVVLIKIRFALIFTGF